MRTYWNTQANQKPRDTLCAGFLILVPFREVVEHDRNANDDEYDHDPNRWIIHNFLVEMAGVEPASGRMCVSSVHTKHA